MKTNDISVIPIMININEGRYDINAELPIKDKKTNIKHIVVAIIWLLIKISSIDKI